MLFLINYYNITIFFKQKQFIINEKEPIQVSIKSLYHPYFSPLLSSASLLLLFALSVFLHLWPLSLSTHSTSLWSHPFYHLILHLVLTTLHLLPLFLFLHTPSFSAHCLNHHIHSIPHISTHRCLFLSHHVHPQTPPPLSMPICLARWRTIWQACCRKIARLNASPRGGRRRVKKG